MILLAFEYHRNLRLPESGEGTPGFGAKPDEIETYHAIVHRIMNQLPVDPERVYLTGIAYGEISALMYAKEYGRELAGMALISGACSPYNISENDFASIPPIPVIHIRGDADTACDGYPDGVNLTAKETLHGCNM